MKVRWEQMDAGQKLVFVGEVIQKGGAFLLLIAALIVAVTLIALGAAVT